MQVNISLFPQDMIQYIFIGIHWNTVHKSIGVAKSVGPYKLISLPGHPILNLT